MLWLVVVIGLVILFFASGIRIVRPTERGLVERFGKYNRFSNPGFNWVIPIIESLRLVNITETMVDAEKQEIITDDNLNAIVDAQIYFKVNPDEDSVKASQYNVNNVVYQIVNLARTTLRNIIGTLSLKDANSKRSVINEELMKTLSEETKSWGISVVRAELKEINPPQDVQDTMNKIVKASNEKVAAIDFATAKETEADGFMRAEVKKAEGIKQKQILEAEGFKQKQILEAEGKSKAIELENTALQKYFKDNAIDFKRLEVTERALKSGTKYVIEPKTGITNVISEVSGVIPVKDNK